VVIGPVWGVDAAVIRIGNKYMIINSDPITAASKYIGWLSVNIITNDVIVMGGIPQWVTMTFLFRRDISESEIDNITQQVDKAARQIGVAIVGGHTEITSYLPNNIIVGTAMGMADRYYSSSGAREGDYIIMTKGAAIEGTAVLSMEFEDKLIKAGVSNKIIRHAKSLIKDTSVIKEASLIIKKYGNWVDAMHDPTEGGILSALHEIADSSNVGMEIDISRIYIKEETKIVTSCLGVDPLSLLGSGSLLVVVKPDVANKILTDLHHAGIWADIIGIVKDRKYGKIALLENKRMPLPYPERDEIWRII